jgi:hypothetical protein
MWINFHIAYAPNVVVTDQGSVKIHAICQAFPFAKIHFCAWHVLHAWERSFTYDLLSIEGSLTKEEKGEIKDKVSDTIFSVLHVVWKRQCLQTSCILFILGMQRALCNYV